MTQCISRKATSRCFECTRDLGQRRLLGFAHQHAADAKKAAFRGRFGDMPADLLQPALIGRSVTGRLGVDYCGSIPQCFDTSVFYLGGLAVFEFVLQSVTCRASLGRSEIVDNRLDEGISSRIGFGFRQLSASSKALLQETPQSAWLGSRNSDTSRNHAFQKTFPFVRCKVRLVRHCADSFAATRT